ncbi:MAG: hypothetical protein LBN29_03190 [Mediterranea sp.]|jgi:hypothetical protein|nr:hypothetical protein [Mediterranea sp.]
MKLERKIDAYIKRYYGDVLPIEVKSGKDYERHRALSNIPDGPEYRIPQALALSGENLRTRGKVVCAPIYMTMFVRRDVTFPAFS